MQILKDDSGVDHFLDASAGSIVSRVAPSIAKYV
jgi:hypothetical protein